MSAIKRVRESVDAKLDRLDVRADAFGAVLYRTKEQMDEPIEDGKREIHCALDKLKAELGKVKHLPAERKEKISAAMDALRLQTALGKAEASDALVAARRRVREISQNVEAEVEAGLVEVKSMPAEALDVAIGVYVRAVDRLDAELEAAETRFATTTARAGTAFDTRRQEVVNALVAFKQQLAAKKDHADEKLVAFEAEVRGGFAQVRKAFKDLFA